MCSKNYCTVVTVNTTVKLQGQNIPVQESQTKKGSRTEVPFHKVQESQAMNCSNTGVTYCIVFRHRRDIQN